jgi:hypothetical protein
MERDITAGVTEHAGMNERLALRPITNSISSLPVPRVAR